MAKGVPQLQKILDELVYKVYKPAYEDSVILAHADNTDAYGDLFGDASTVN